MPSLVVGTAGHIDHGKSTLVEALTGTDPDRLQEEKERGITIDLGFAHAAIGALDVAFVDVPGHERFVRNMLAGAGGIDAVVLVVAADESVMPQTREHLAICRLLGVRQGIVAMTKADLVDEETRGLVALEVGDLVAGSPFEGAPVIPVSARTGEGLEVLRAALGRLVPGASRRSREGIARLPIDRVFVVKGFGTVVTGTLVSGQVRPDDYLELLPDRRAVRVRGAQVHGRGLDVVESPSRVALNLGSIDHAELARGATLASTGALPVTRRVDVVIDMLPDARPLRHGARVRVHHGTSEIIGRVSIAATRASMDDGWRPAAPGESGVAVASGGRGYVRVRLEQAAVLTRGDLVVLRAWSPPTTIGGGRVLDPEPPRTGIRRPAMSRRFEVLDLAESPLSVWLEEAGGRGVTSADLVRRGGLAPDAARRSIRALCESGSALAAGDRVFPRAEAERIATAATRAVGAYHTDHAQEPGMPRALLRERAAPTAAQSLFDAVMGELIARGDLTGTDQIAVPSHEARLSPAEADLSAWVEEKARVAGLAALDLATLKGERPRDGAAVDAAVRWLSRERRLVRVDSLLVHGAALEQLKDDVREWAASPDVQLDVSAFKTRFGLTRKHAIPLLEWLDRERVTRRVGNVRRLVG